MQVRSRARRHGPREVGPTLFPIVTARLASSTSRRDASSAAALAEICPVGPSAGAQRKYLKEFANRCCSLEKGCLVFQRTES